MSGRELYNYKKEIFKDQEDADDGIDILNAIKEDEKSSKDDGIEAVAEKVEKDLFLEGDDLDDLDDLEDD